MSPGKEFLSLLDMLEFSAQEYINLTYQLGLLLGKYGDRKPDDTGAGEALGNLLSESNRLGMPVTQQQIANFVLELLKENPDRFELSPDRTVFKTKPGTTLPQERICHHIESIYSTLRAELGSRIVRMIPSEKNIYCSSEWLTNSAMFKKFPESIDEFQKAGRCFAYGENTACVFHL